MKPELGKIYWHETLGPVLVEINLTPEKVFARPLCWKKENLRVVLISKLEMRISKTEREVREIIKRNWKDFEKMVKAGEITRV
jgi:hypothetical protein